MSMNEIRDAQIVTRYKAGETQESLAKAYGVTRTRITQILGKAGVTWKDSPRARQLYGFIGINVTKAVKDRCMLEAANNKKSLSRFVGDLILRYLASVDGGSKSSKAKRTRINAWTRREMLVKMFGAATALAVAPLIDLTDKTASFWNQPALQKLMPWRITFHDGTVYEFAAHVVDEKVSDDGLISLTVRPTGALRVSQGIAFPINYTDQDQPNNARAAETVPSIHALETVIEGQCGLMSLQGVKLPELTLLDSGMKRPGVLTFIVKPFESHT